MNHGLSAEEKEPVLIPAEVEVFINPDGTVSFADLAEEMIPVAAALNPTETLWCSTDNASASPSHDS